MADLVNASAQAIADALAPSPHAPAARWRWGSVVSVNADGTMNVSIGGATVPSVRCAQHVMGAQVGDRVRVLYCGTECMVDAVRATSRLMSVPSPSMTASAQSAWLAALGFEFGTYSGTVNVTSSWYGMYYGTATIPITARADTSYRVLATLRCAGNLVWCSLNSKSTSSFEVFVISPRNSAQAVSIDWAVLGGYTPSGGGDAPEYTGQTVFTPSEATQTAQTAGMVLNGNITINPIPSDYGHVEYDGSTLTIS